MSRDIAELFLINFIKSVIEIKAPYSPQNNMSQIQNSILQRAPIRQVQIKTIPIMNIKKPINYQPHINYSNMSQLSATDKLNMLIKDPYINEIECVGADNPLVVKKSGMTQNTQITLLIEEIYEIIAEFSQKTRIPVINGRIKAALNNLIITAVLSETLGPRFIIQKRASNRPLI